MLTRRENESKYKRQEITYISLEEMVPADHLVRKIDAVMDWKWIYKKVENLYSENTGRPSVDPIILVYYDVYICPEGNILKYSTTDRNGYSH